MKPTPSSRCRVCGEAASAGARFCPRCGARLVPPQVTDEEQEEPDEPGSREG